VTRKAYYRERTVLSDISVEIEHGEVIGIIGPNGAGKSTLLKIIAGKLAPTSGRVQVAGRLSAILELGTGFNPEYSGRDNVITGGMCLGMNRAEIEERLPWIIEFTELGHVIDQAFKTYSSGMQARLTFATAICADPEILILDEALAAGDAYFVHKCMRRIRDICNSGATVLFVTHGSALIAQLCTRAIWIDRGKIREMGSAREIARHYDYDIHAHISNGEGKLVEIAANEDASASCSSTSVAHFQSILPEQPSSSSLCGTATSTAAPPKLCAGTADDPASTASIVREEEVETDTRVLASLTRNEAPPPSSALNEQATKILIFRRGPVLIDNITVSSGDGQPRFAFWTWEDIIVDVDYHCEGRIPEDTLGLALGIERETDMIMIAQFSTVNFAGNEEVPYDEAPFRKKPAQKGRISAELRKSQLLAGDYLLSIGLIANHPLNQEFYEYRHRVYRLRIIPTGFNSAAVYYPLVTWKHEHHE
jgi:ABC-type polysaccharide/polyol phosphate transport system ATPase subunit